MIRDRDDTPSGLAHELAASVAGSMAMITSIVGAYVARLLATNTLPGID